MELYSNRLFIRDINKEDLNFLLDLEQNPLVQEFRDFILTFDEINKMYLGSIEQNVKIPRTEYCLIVENLKDKLTLGKINLTLVSKEIDEWEIGWIFHPIFWKNGYATEASRKVIEFFIKDLEVHRIIAMCYSGNIKSENLMKRIGMKKEGCLRKVKFFKNTWHDEVIYSFLYEDLK